MKVLLAGATGFTGRRIAADLAAGGHRVRCFLRAGADASGLPGGPFESVVGDLDEFDTVRAALSGVDALVFAASLGFGHGPGAVRACVEAGVRRAVFFSSTGIFTRLAPESKGLRRGAEEAIRESALAWTILRPTMIYGGPGDRNVERLLRAAARWPFLPLVAGGRRKIQPVFVDDLAEAAVRALETPCASRRVYDLPGRRPLTVREFFAEAFRAVGRRPRFLPVPAPLALGAAALAEALLPRAPVRREQVARLLEDKDFEWAPARADLGYEPVDPVRGLGIAAARLGLGGPP